MENIIVFGLNPALQRTLTFSKGFEKGEVNRSDNVSITIGGKGQQVTKAISIYSNNVKRVNVHLFQFLGGDSGRLIEKMQDNRNTEFHTQYIEFGETRTCITLVERNINQSTEIIEPSTIVTKIEADSLIKSLNALLERKKDNVELCVISGTLPPGIDIQYYFEIIKILNKHKVKVILDAYKDINLILPRCEIFLLKINMFEFSQIIDEEIDWYASFTIFSNNSKQLYEKLRHFKGKFPNIENIGITNGSNSSYLCETNVILEYKMPKIIPVSPIGAGDVTTAITASYLLHGKPLKESFCRGLSAAISCCLTLEGGVFNFSETEEFYKFISESVAISSSCN